MYVKTTKSEQIWQSPDKQRTIWEVTLKTADDKEYQVKTFSEQVATIGFEGEVRSYVNERNERYVRQVPGADKAGYTRDDSAIKAQWAIGQAVALFNDSVTSIVLREGDDTAKAIQETAAVLFNMVNNVKGEQ